MVKKYIQLGDYVCVEELNMLGRLHSEVFYYPCNAHIYEASPLSECTVDFLLTLQHIEGLEDSEEIKKLWEKDTKEEVRRNLIKKWNAILLLSCILSG